MVKPALLLAALALAPGLATFAVAQENDPERYWSVEDGSNWYLQRSTCTLAHNDDATGVTVWFRQAMGVHVEFARRGLGGVREGEDITLTLIVDGTSEEILGALGSTFAENRSGYRFPASHELLARVGVGRRMEVRRGAETVLRLDFQGGGPAVAALENCNLEAAGEAMASENGMDPFANIIANEM